MTYEGDLIRPLGLMVLYASYAEGELDEVIESLSTAEPYGDDKRGWNVGRKLKLAQRLARQFSKNDLSELVEFLKAATPLFEKRNALVHGRLFQGGRLESNRRTNPITFISADEITRVAEDIWAWKNQIWLQKCKNVLTYKNEAAERGT